MQLIVPIFSLVLLAAGNAYAQAPQIERIDITEYGIYTLDREARERKANGITQAQATAVRHTATTRTVPVQIGTTFGLRYKVVGKPQDAPVELRNVVVFPSPGLRPSPSSAPVSRYEFMVQTRIGETSYVSYTLEDSFELVPGTWVIEVWHGNRKMAWQSFSAVKPDTGSDTRCRSDTCTGF